MKTKFAIALMIATSQAMAATSRLSPNKETVRAFYELAFNEHKPEEAVKKYVGEKYTQHNPFVADGKQAFVDFFLGFQKRNPDAHIEIKRMVGENDLVVVHVHSVLGKMDRGRAVMDIFRLENGKIVEHWDVGQLIPEKGANENGMF